MSFRLIDWLRRLLKQTESLLLFNQEHWDHLARKKWLINGNSNYSYFIKRATQRQKMQSIPPVKDGVGVKVQDQ